ncbi:MAG: hypothetical protein GY702_10700, partial [Desulfobulbaceae bacterium]|nr:hypothetical protein [Desulfobulbaceae bacterium]
EGRELIIDEQEREAVSYLNLRASKKAKKSNAFRPAFECARVAKALLLKNAWRVSYDHCFEVYQEYADTAYLSGEFDIADEIIQLLLEKAKTKLEKASIHRMQVRQYVISGKDEEAILAGIKASSVLGLKFSMEPSRLSVLKELALVKWNLGKRSVESLIDMPLLEDIEKQTAMKIAVELSASVYTIGLENLFAMLALKGVNIALRFGNSPQATVSYVG